MIRLSEAEWTARRAAHEARIAPLIEPHVRRKSTGRTHPVVDFLFTYYSLRPSLLRRWGPGYGVVLEGQSASKFLQFKGYKAVAGGVSVDPELLSARRSSVEFVVALLAATESRPAQLGCFGLHEWAMVYRGGDSAVRHSGVPLRLGRAGTDAVVESIQLRCTHYDAFRFFTPDAVPRNESPLTRADQLGREQPGCLHASMDLYKWGYKLGPLIDSDVLADCFDLAVDARELDMRASPYDLSEFGYTPVAIDTPHGRAEYVRAQSALTERATVLRSALLQRCRRLLSTQPLPM